MIEMIVRWRKPWYSNWAQGGIERLDSPVGIQRIYRHSGTGEIRVYSERGGWPLDGREIAVNSEVVTLHRRGRWGRLHTSRS